MSSQRGNVKRTRSQKHKNSVGFKNNMHDTTDKIKMLNDLEVSGCCARCKDIIDWKIKYKKYKPLSQPKTCSMCKQKTVMKAYYLLCEPCSLEKQVCAKCGDKRPIVQQPGPSLSEEQKQNALFRQELRSLSEKKRRKFLRMMGTGQLKMGEMPSSSTASQLLDNESDDDDGEIEEEEDDSSDNNNTSPAPPAGPQSAGEQTSS